MMLSVSLARPKALFDLSGYKFLCIFKCFKNWDFAGIEKIYET